MGVYHSCRMMYTGNIGGFINKAEFTYNNFSHNNAVLSVLAEFLSFMCIGVWL